MTRLRQDDPASTPTRRRSRPATPDLRAVVRRAAKDCPDPLVRRWLRRLLAGDEAETAPAGDDDGKEARDE